MPLSLAKALNEKYVILVKVFGDGALVGGIAHHDVINAPIGDKAEEIQQLSNVGNVVVNGLHQ